MTGEGKYGYVLSLRVACPDCGAVKGDGCVYLWPKGVTDYGNNNYLHTKGVRASIDLAGKLTKRPHQSRVQLGRAVQARREARQRAKHGQVGPSAEVLAVVRALQQFDLAEHQALKSWLRSYADVLIDANKEQRHAAT